MDAEKQRVLGFFIEGAREHLDTIERGLLNLQAAMADPEQVNELFRAAHSVKGDAAMLSLNGIHKVAHRLEDCFKLLQEHPVRIDQQVESLFLRGFDTLHELVEKLQLGESDSEGDAQRVISEVEPVFQQLLDYLRHLSGKGGKAIPPDFENKVTATLKQMLPLFRAEDNPAGRQKLVLRCDQLAQLDPGVEAWQTLTMLSKRALLNSKASYRELAPVLVKEIKNASMLIVANKGHEVAPSSALLGLAGPAPAPAVPPAAALPQDPKDLAKLLIRQLDRKQLITLAQILVRYIKQAGA
ncbi:MAG: histidine kinase [Synechococcales cyanobacterium RM1_1_8]|nr:histidine kinase [Synechococcales cyanobacterium RM1_1_8]